MYETGLDHRARMVSLDRPMERSMSITDVTIHVILV